MVGKQIMDLFSDKAGIVQNTGGIDGVPGSASARN
jgi:hypothetical protein